MSSETGQVIRAACVDCLSAADVWLTSPPPPPPHHRHHHKRDIMIAQAICMEIIEEAARIGGFHDDLTVSGVALEAPGGVT